MKRKENFFHRLSHSITNNSLFLLWITLWSNPWSKKRRNTKKRKRKKRKKILYYTKEKKTLEFAFFLHILPSWRGIYWQNRLLKDETVTSIKNWELSPWLYRENGPKSHFRDKIRERAADLLTTCLSRFEFSYFGSVFLHI